MSEDSFDFSNESIDSIGPDDPDVNIPLEDVELLVEAAANIRVSSVQLRRLARHIFLLLSHQNTLWPISVPQFPGLLALRDTYLGEYSHLFPANTPGYQNELIAHPHQFAQAFFEANSFLRALQANPAVVRNGPVGHVTKSYIDKKLASKIPDWDNWPLPLKKKTKGNNL